MAQQWGGGQPGYQYPMQTGFQPNPSGFQQQQPAFSQGIAPQPTGFPQQQRPAFQQPQQTGFPGAPSFGSIQSQQTGFLAGGFQSQPVPPVPPLPSSFGGGSGFAGTQLRAPPPPPPQRSFMSPVSGGGLAPQMTGFPGANMGGPPAAPLVPQVTGYVDPRLQMMSTSFMPANPSVPFSGQMQFQGIPNAAPGTSLVQNIQQYNQEQAAAPPSMSWTLSRAEKKNYDQIFRSWDAQGTGFISGQMALEVFGQSGLDKNMLAKIWALADTDNRGKLNLAEFHVAMGLIYRKLNGLEVPDQLPSELVPPSSRDLDTSVNFLKDILKHDTSRPTSTDPISRSKVRSFNDTGSPAAGGRKDGTVYKHTEDEDTGSYYRSRSRHIDRRDVRVGNESPGEDLDSIRRQLENAASTLDRSKEEQSARTREDEELEREMEDLRYRVKRIQEDLEYVSRGPRSYGKDEERRKLERDLMHLMHERIPEVQKKQEEREKRREREKRDWARERDRRNERSGRYDERSYDSGYSRYERDREYERDRDRDYRDRDLDRDRDYDRDRGYGRDRDYDGRERLYGREREYDRPRSPPTNARSPPPPPPAPSLTVANPPPAPKPTASPAPLTKSMSAEERQAYIHERAQRMLQERMRALGVSTPGPAADSPSASPAVDTSVEDRLAKEKEEAQRKAEEAEKAAEERERARRERLDAERALKEGRSQTPSAPPASSPVSSVASAKPAPPPIVKRAPAPPPPMKRGAPKPPVASRAPVPPVPTVVTTAPPPLPPPAAPEEDEEEKAIREREERLRKAKEERMARLRQLEQEEEEARHAEEQYKARRQQISSPKAPLLPLTPPAPPVQTTVAVLSPPPPPAPPVLQSTPLMSPPTEKASTNPFNKLMNQGGATANPGSASSSGTNPFFKPTQAAPPTASTPPAPQVAPPAPVAPSAPVRSITPARSPAPPSGPTSYHTAPADDDDDWGDAKEFEEDDSSDDEIMSSRQQRDKLAQQIFGGGLSRPQSAAAGVAGQQGQSLTPPPMSAPPVTAPAPPPPPPAPMMTQTFSEPVGGILPPPPPPPMAPPAPAPPMAASSSAPSLAPASDRSALFSSIISGKALRKTQTHDRSGASVTGSVVGDSAPPSHVLNAPRPVSPPAAPPALPAVEEQNGHADANQRAAHRQSVDWYAGLAADAGKVSPMPAMAEEPEEPEEPEKPAPAPVPEIQVNAAPTEAVQEGPMEDVDRSKQMRVRTLYPYEGQRAEDISFAENVILSAHPSKSGGAWWFGTGEKDGKSGFFPSTYVQEVENVKAKALYSYEGGSADELPFVEGDLLTIIDRSEADWWKTESAGVVFIVPAAYLEVVDASPIPADNDSEPTRMHPSSLPRLSFDNNYGLAGNGSEMTRVSSSRLDGSTHAPNGTYRNLSAEPFRSSATGHVAGVALPLTATTSNSTFFTVADMSIDAHPPLSPLSDDGSGADDDEYHSFESEDSDDDTDGAGMKSEDERRAEAEARELERIRVLEAAGLLVESQNQIHSSSGTNDRSTLAGGSGALVRRRSTKTRRRRVPPEVPQGDSKDGPSSPRASIDYNRLSVASMPLPSRTPSSTSEKDLPQTPKSTLMIDDAFERYEQYRQSQGQKQPNYRLSVSSFDTSFTCPPSPNSSAFPQSTPLTSTPSRDDNREKDKDREPSIFSASLGGEGRSYSHIFSFLSKSKSSSSGHAGENERPKLQISGPIHATSSGGTIGSEEYGQGVEGGNGSAFGSSWASLLDASTLEGIPASERKRQEAIFELINTEAAYVRNLQLIVEAFYSSMIALLTEKEVTVVFANIEDLLLVNTTFLSSLEERQKECRLYIDNVGDLLQQYMGNMNVYSEYCINQGNAIKILQSIRDNRPDVAMHLSKLRDDPAVRNLDLSSYLLEPMQRITRYPLLIRQVLHYTENETDRAAIEEALRAVERVLTLINEAIREQEGRARLEAVSKNLYVGQGRLDLTKSTSYMGQRKLMREGTLAKMKSGRKLKVFLCNDMIVLTDEAVSRLYKMPIQLNQVEVKEVSSKDELSFQLVFAYPRGGEAMAFRTSSAKDCQSWVKDISRATRKARDLERRAARAALANKQRPSTTP